MPSFKLLTAGQSNPKTAKGDKLAYSTAILHLSPAKLSGRNVCAFATAGCAAACLNTAGRGGMFQPGGTNSVQEARLRRTRYFFADKAAFMVDLHSDITKHVAAAFKAGLTPCVRLNGTSDIPWENVKLTVNGVTYANIMAAFPTVQFYDYTKNPGRRNLPDNYVLTFSLAESNRDHAVSALLAGMNVAAVFNVKTAVTGRWSADPLPSEYMGVAVIDGDDHDLRFLDPRGVVVGLRAKGRAKKDTTGFVQHV